MVINRAFVDAGHGGKEPGAVSSGPERLREADLVLPIAWYVYDNLSRENDIIPILSRTNDFDLADYTMGLNDDRTRAWAANRYNKAGDVKAFVSIHINSTKSRDPNIEGFEVWYYPGSIKGRRLAESIIDWFESYFPERKNRGIKPMGDPDEIDYAKSLIVLRETVMPAVIVEVDFINNWKWIIDNQEAIAAMIAAGIKDYLREYET
jgi:N-acetylmuramoyl-L-alanine amidase